METDLRLCGDRWVLSGDPYVLYRAESAIPYSTKEENGAISYPASEELAVELMWFCQRFKSIRNHHEGELRRAAARHSIRRVEVGKILAGDFRTDAVGFKHGKVPRGYQVQAAMLVRANGGLLCADELGVGKTVTGLATIADRSMLPAVVVAPANLTLQWRNVVDEFMQGFTAHVINKMQNYDPRVVATCEKCGEAATQKSVSLKKCSYCKGQSFERSLADVYLISYHKMHAWHRELEKFVKTIIFDEAQELRRCDTPMSKKYEACHRISRKAQFRLLLSGTPIHNFGGEMFNVMDVACPGRLGSKTHFREQWCHQVSESGKEPMLKEPEALSRYLHDQGMMVRRTRADVGREIPPIQTIVQNVDTDDKVFNRLTKDAKELARIVLRMTTNEMQRGAQMKAAGQLSAIVRHATGMSKAACVANFVRLILESGEPVMLFGWHIDVEEVWSRELKEFNPVLYTGQQGPNAKEESKRKFVSGESQLMICSLQSGRGLDGIQGRCKVGVFGELDHSPAIHKQCVGRYHRDGQKDQCLTYYLVSDSGSDPLMMESLNLKATQVRGVIQDRSQSTVLSQRETTDHLQRLAEQFLQAG